MRYKIIASDLDKTLLKNDMTVSRENWEAIERLYSLGCHFVPATGRAYEEIPLELRKNPFIRYYLFSNGSAIYDKKEDRLFELAFPRGLGHEVLDKLYQYPTCILLHAENRSYVEESTHFAENYEGYNMNKIWVDYVLDKDAPIPDLKGYAYDLPSIQSFCVFFKKMEDLKACKAHFEKDERLLVAQTDPYNLEIFTSESGKGNGLRYLARILSVPMEETLALGDSYNDTTMIEAAGLGLAVSNSVPELIEMSDAVVCSNEEHVVAYVLDHYMDA